ncbi:hypothetical protein CYLTODRAFT_417901 [Cylindrobasidium torrendii FP15055 ss-10]|uniref:Uncharacterized protein n=1 Tax=Cylindrobasidium torrendii FP15055 ss-10 TaxID=1314674 RepID=A0A0D7BPN1_9AGAR|nr:hypothetical protein CYLTODRAFT_417901 [Cylindrobasidium torrendii FP15055 ss-10]
MARLECSLFFFFSLFTTALAADGYKSPADNGGSMLTTLITYTSDLHEPINAIISGSSDSPVLVNRLEHGGLTNYFLSLNYTLPCFGKIDYASIQTANLGDGDGEKNQTQIMRYNFGDPALGACKESVQGGNHFRYWIQNGGQANTSAIFLAASYEKPAKDGHDIVPDGYNLGRDVIVGNISGSAIDTRSLKAGATYSGTSSHEGWTYETSVEYVSGLLQNTSVGINHNNSVPVDGANAIDGLVAVLQVKITERPANDTDSDDDAAILTYPVSLPSLWLFLAIPFLLFL